MSEYQYIDEKLRSKLIAKLQSAQERDGYLNYDNMRAISLKLGVPLSKVYGVATFYNQFKFNMPGKYQIQVCRGTACHVKGSSNLLDTLTRVLGIGPGETTKDGLFSLEVVACVGVCSLAPVIVMNGEYHAKMTTKLVEKLIEDTRSKEQA